MMDSVDARGGLQPNDEHEAGEVSSNLEWGVYMDTRIRIAAGRQASNGHSQSEGSRGSKTDRRDRARSSNAKRAPQGPLCEQREDAERESDQWRPVFRGRATGPRQRPHRTGCWLAERMCACAEAPFRSGLT